jgi:putative solute:sodium symporter small subunit
VSRPGLKTGEWQWGAAASADCGRPAHSIRLAWRDRFEREGNQPMAQSNTPSRTSANDEAHWRKTTNLMLIHLGIWVFFGYIIHMFVKPLNNIVIPILDFPLGFYMAAQGSLIVFVVMLFAFAKQQNKIDREFGVAEDE